MLRRVKFGVSAVLSRGAPVIGEVVLPSFFSQVSMAVRSYVCPSDKTTGSRITSCVIGHKNSFGILVNG